MGAHVKLPMAIAVLGIILLAVAGWMAYRERHEAAPSITWSWAHPNIILSIGGPEHPGELWCEDGTGKTWKALSDTNGTFCFKGEYLMKNCPYSDEAKAFVCK